MVDVSGDLLVIGSNEIADVILRVTVGGEIQMISAVDTIDAVEPVSAGVFLAAGMASPDPLFLITFNDGSVFVDMVPLTIVGMFPAKDLQATEDGDFYLHTKDDGLVKVFPDVMQAVELEDDTVRYFRTVADKLYYVGDSVLVQPVFKQVSVSSATTYSLLDILDPGSFKVNLFTVSGAQVTYDGLNLGTNTHSLNRLLLTDLESIEPLLSLSDILTDLQLFELAL